MRTHSTVVLLALLGACNAPPGSPDIAIAPDAPTTVDDLVGSVTAEAVDPNDDPITYRWTWTVDGQATELTTETVPADRTRKGEVWEASVTAVDENGNESEESAVASVEVRNTPPTATATAADESPASTDNLVVQHTTDDIDGDEVTVRYSWTRDGNSGGITADTVPADQTAKGEVWIATVTPNDGEVDGEPATADFVVANVRPRITELSLVPADPTEANIIEAQVASIDDDGDPVTYSYRWTVNGVTVDGAVGTTIDGRSFDKGDEVRVEVTPDDGFTVGDPTLSDPVTVQNTPPTIDSATIEPSIAREGDTLSCAPAGWNDIDGDSPGYLRLWTVDGSTVSTAETLTGANFDRDQVVTCTVTPFDGEDEGVEVVSASITIQNTPPTLASIDIDQKSPRTNDTLSVTLGATADDDGDVVSVGYRWLVDGTLVGTGTTLSGTNFEHTDEVVVEATPTDGTHPGLTVSSSTVTIENTPPVLTSAIVSPSTLYTDSTAGITFTATDADGHSVSADVSWYVDGVFVGTRSTLDGTTAFSKGDKISAQVTPDDGYDTGMARTTAAITVLNTPPTAPVVEISPEEPTEGEDDLVCEITTASTDNDSDKVTYTFGWTVDGKPFTRTSTTTYTGDTIDASHTDADEKWLCNVTPNDGEDDGTDASATVTVAAEYPRITAVGRPVQQTSGKVTYGAWLTDPRSPSGSVYVMPHYDNKTAVTVYSSLADLKSGKVASTITLPYGYDGTGHTIYNGALYYNEANTNNMIRYNLSTGKVTHRVALSGAVYHNQAYYQWGGFSDIDFAGDETGLYVIYATSSTGNIVISQLNPATLAVTKTWTTTRQKRTAGNSWMAEGYLYVTASYSASSTTIDYIYDTHKSSGSTASITFLNSYGYNSMIDYNYGDQNLYSWDDAEMVLYSLTF